MRCSKPDLFDHLVDATEQRSGKLEEWAVRDTRNGKLWNIGAANIGLIPL